jgi:hypothetical protein
VEQGGNQILIPRSTIKEALKYSYILKVTYFKYYPDHSSLLLKLGIDLCGLGQKINISYTKQADIINLSYLSPVTLMAHMLIGNQLLLCCNVVNNGGKNQ